MSERFFKLRFHIALCVILLTCIPAVINVNTRDVKGGQDLTEQIRDQQNILLKQIFQNADLKIRTSKRSKCNKEFTDYKNQYKQAIITRGAKGGVQSSSAQSPTKTSFQSFLHVAKNKNKFINDLDDPGYFFGTNNYEKNINNLPMTGAGATAWSGSYWPMRNALLAVRYDKSDKNTIGDWNAKKNQWTKEYTWQESVQKFNQPAEYNSLKNDGKTIMQTYINTYMSPAEKYDILVGDYNFGLTNYMRWYSQQFVTKGDIPGWFGICHGWVPASYYYKQPVLPVTLVAADGQTRVTFYQDDCKALSSQFWANASYTTRFVGYPCPYSDPSQIQTDPDSGLYTDPQCASVNAGAFVLIIANQMGIGKKNFAFDPNPDGEKWNQPVQQYSLQYYNLLTLNFAASAHLAKISIGSIKNYTDDSFLMFLYKKAPTGTTDVVGFFVTVVYGVETEPVHSDKPLGNYNQSEDYIGALYLDKNENILGGQWKYNFHPNFMWKPDESVPPKGVYDSTAPIYNGSSSSVRQLTAYAIKASSYGQPLKTIVDVLHLKASGGQ